MLTPEDRDYIIRTVYGEAAGEGPVGQQAVAAVILNRARERGLSPRDVVLQRRQFEPWSARARELLALDPSGDAYGAVARNIDPFLQGQVPSPVGGADHFYSPGAQAALGRATPAWAQGRTGTDIGGHTFFDLEGPGAAKGASASSARAELPPEHRPSPSVTPQEAANYLASLGGAPQGGVALPGFQAAMPTLRRHRLRQIV